MLNFLSRILAEPLWLVIWVGWLGSVNLASLLFLRHVEARWVLAAFACNLVFMTWLFGETGYNRLLGLSHVIFWTPLLIYLYRRRERIPTGGAFAGWVWVLIATNAVSLLIDYVDVARYLAGDRS